jgi:transposase
VLIATADDLPIGAAVCGANRQDATFSAAALSSVVIDPPVDRPAAVKAMAENPLRRDGKRSRGQLHKLKQILYSQPDVRAFPYVRGDGSFAKIPAQAQARQQGFRLWAPKPRTTRVGLGRIRSSVERAHALLNQFGRVARRFDRRANRYLGWVQLACCMIFMRQGFFP